MHGGEESSCHPHMLILVCGTFELAFEHIIMSNVEANLRHIARHEAKPNPKALSQTTLTRGFEAVAYPKIVRELKDTDLVVKQKSLLAARELLGSPTSYVQCIAHGMTAAVVHLLKVRTMQLN